MVFHYYISININNISKLIQQKWFPISPKADPVIYFLWWSSSQIGILLGVRDVLLDLYGNMLISISAIDLDVIYCNLGIAENPTPSEEVAKHTRTVEY